MEQGTGTVVFYDPRADYGFIEADDGRSDVIFSMRPGEPSVAVGDVVGFELIRPPQVTPRGREALRIWKVGFPQAVA